MPTPTYRLLTNHFPLLSLDGPLGGELLADLQSWEFDPNETHHNQSLLEAFLRGLPKNLSGTKLAAAEGFLDFLIQRGADPTATTRPLEDLGPQEWAERLVALRGGSIQAHRERLEIKAMIPTLPNSQSVRELKHSSYDEATDRFPAKTLLGAPQSVWALALMPGWKSLPIQTGQSQIHPTSKPFTTKQSSLVKQMVGWVESEEAELHGQAARVLAWAIAKPKLTQANPEPWANLLDALASHGFSDDRIPDLASSLLEQLPTPLVSEAALVIARGLVALNHKDVITPLNAAWQSLQDSHTLLEDHQEKAERREILSNLFMKCSPHLCDEEASWLPHLSPTLTMALVAQVLTNINMDKRISETWWSWTRDWMHQHPKHARKLAFDVARNASINGIAKLPDVVKRISAVSKEIRLGNAFENPPAHAGSRPRL